MRSPDLPKLRIFSCFKASRLWSSTKCPAHFWSVSSGYWDGFHWSFSLSRVFSRSNILCCALIPPNVRHRQSNLSRSRFLRTDLFRRLLCKHSYVLYPCPLLSWGRRGSTRLKSFKSLGKRELIEIYSIKGNFCLWYGCSHWKAFPFKDNT